MLQNCDCLAPPYANASALLNDKIILISSLQMVIYYETQTPLGVSVSQCPARIFVEHLCDTCTILEKSDKCLIS